MRHPGTDSSMKVILLLGLLRAKGRRGIIGPSRLYSLGRGATQSGLKLCADRVRGIRKLGEGRMTSIFGWLSSSSPIPCRRLLLAKANGKPGARRSVKAKQRGQLPGCGASQIRAEKGWASWRGHEDQRQHVGVCHPRYH